MAGQPGNSLSAKNASELVFADRFASGQGCWSAKLRKSEFPVSFSPRIREEAHLYRRFS
jgi:hypothetical protein